MKLTKTQFQKIVKKVLNEDGHNDVPSARRKLRTSIEDAHQILDELDRLGDHENLPSWWMSKITLAANYLNKTRDYLIVPSGAERVHHHADDMMGDLLNEDKHLSDADIHVYIVQKGDTLSKIHKQRGHKKATLADQIALNPGIDPYKLSADQQIKIYKDPSVPAGSDNIEDLLNEIQLDLSDVEVRAAKETLEKEGGAAGPDVVADAVKNAEEGDPDVDNEDVLAALMKADKGIKRHGDGDIIDTSNLAESRLTRLQLRKIILEELGKAAPFGSGYKQAKLKGDEKKLIGHT